MTNPRVSPAMVDLMISQFEAGWCSESNADHRVEHETFLDLRDCRAALAAADERIATLQATDLDQMNMIERLEREKAAAEKEREAIREREAACCPEDVPFDEYVRALTKQLAEAEAVLLKLEDIEMDVANLNDDDFAAVEAAVTRARARKP